MSKPEAELDARGLLCPLPVLKIRKRLAPLAAGDVLRAWTDDPMAEVDVPHFCSEAGHRILRREAEGTGQVWEIRKGG